MWTLLCLLSVFALQNKRHRCMVLSFKCLLSPSSTAKSELCEVVVSQAYSWTQGRSIPTKSLFLLIHSVKVSPLQFREMKLPNNTPVFKFVSGTRLTLLTIFVMRALIIFLVRGEILCWLICEIIDCGRFVDNTVCCVKSSITIYLRCYLSIGYIVEKQLLKLSSRWIAGWLLGASFGATFCNNAATP